MKYQQNCFVKMKLIYFMTLTKTGLKSMRFVNYPRLLVRSLTP